MQNMVTVCFITVRKCDMVVCSTASVCVCLSVLFGLLTFENFDLETLFLEHRYIFGICRSGSYIKVIGSGLRVTGAKSVSVCPERP